MARLASLAPEALYSLTRDTVIKLADEDLDEPSFAKVRADFYGVELSRKETIRGWGGKE